MIAGIDKAADVSRAVSRTAGMYDPPPMAQRAFESDYRIAPSGELGARLDVDMDGLPIDPGAMIAGRRAVGGDDVGLSEAEADALAHMFADVQRVKRSGPELKGDAGRYVRDPVQPRIYVDKALDPASGARVQAHELGHALDKHLRFTRDGMEHGLPVEGNVPALREVYERLNTPQHIKPGKGYQPESHKYKGEEVNDELNAEAIRAYLINPNYLKSVAPKVAARIREYLNAHPEVSKRIHFNAMVPGAVGVEELHDKYADK